MRGQPKPDYDKAIGDFMANGLSRPKAVQEALKTMSDWRKANTMRKAMNGTKRQLGAGWQSRRRLDRETRSSNGKKGSKGTWESPNQYRRGVFFPY